MNKSLSNASRLAYLINKNAKMIYSSVSNKTQPVRSFDEIPGPKRFPFVGNLFELKPFGGDLDFIDLHGTSLKLHKIYGDIVCVKIFNHTALYIFDAESVRKVFNADGESPYKSVLMPFKKYYEYRKMPANLVSTNGEQWRKLRTASNPIAARPQNVASFLLQQNKIVDDLVSLINGKFQGNSNEAILKDFEYCLKTVTLELVSVIAYDKRIGCIGEKNQDHNMRQLLEAMDEFFTTMNRLMYELLPYGPYFPRKMWRRLVASADKHVTQRYAELSKQSAEYKTDVTSKSILEQYLLTMDKYGLNIEDVTVLTADLLLGGIDTTATVIHYLLYELGQNPEVQEQLYEEVKVNYTDGVLTEDALSKMPYLKAAVKECLRFHPVLPGTERLLKEDLVLNNFFVPKGTSVIISGNAMARFEHYFKNSNKFDPKRWLRVESKNKEDVIHPYAYLPFGFGARQCIGRRIAEQEIYLVATKLIYNYKIEYVGEITGHKHNLVFSPDKPLHIKLIKRAH